MTYRQRKPWNFLEFNKINLPLIVGQISPIIMDWSEQPIRVLDMPVYMPQQGWHIPSYIKKFQHIIEKVADAEKELEPDGYDKYYYYITIDQKVVPVGETGRRSGAHSDAYNDVPKLGERVTHTYIAYNSIPTEFFLSKFPLGKTGCEDSAKQFNAIANKPETPIVTYSPYQLLKLDPYVVHRCGTSVETVRRTFVKISVSEKKYARKGNTHNDEFDYEWAMTPRTQGIRNHPW